MQRIPKLRGFTNPFRVAYTPVNLGALEEVEGDTVDVARFVAARPRQEGRPGQGPRWRRAHPQADRCRPTRSRSRPTEAITAAGGTVTVVPLPFGHGRPPARGNALTNR